MIYKKILSYPDFCSFGDSFDYFFKEYNIENDLEIYFFYGKPSEEEDLNEDYEIDIIENSNFSENEEGTSFEDLKKINYKSDIIIWFSVDSIIGSTENFNFYKNDDFYFLKDLREICNLHKDKKFILFIANQNKGIEEKNLPYNLYITSITNTKINGEYSNKIYEKNNKEKKWVLLNSEARIHRIALLLYLLHLKLEKNGFISNSRYIKNIFENKSLSVIRNIKNYFKFEEDVIKNFNEYRKKIINSKDVIKPYSFYQRKNKGKSINIENFNNTLNYFYSNFFLEIVTGTFFHEPFAMLSEKEAHVFLAKNFPIFIGPSGTVSYIRKNWNMNLFDDLINHDYDKIKDPTIRLKKAIDDNIHLLNGKVDLEKEWKSREKKINENYFQIRKLFNTEYQKSLDFVFIKEALDYFNIPYREKN